MITLEYNTGAHHFFINYESKINLSIEHFIGKLPCSIIFHGKSQDILKLKLIIG